jgi:hypothetical protein
MLITLPDVDETTQGVDTLRKIAEGVEVTDLVSHRSALETIGQIKQMERTVKAKFADSKSAANKAHKTVVAFEKSMLDPLVNARETLWSKCSTYDMEQERIAAEKQREVEAELRKKAEEERILDAAEAEDAGETEEANAILDAPVVVESVVVEPDVAKVEGISKSYRYSAEVVSFMTFAKWAVKNERFELLAVNQANLNRLATMQKENLKVPGVKLVKKASVRVSS